MMIVLGRANRRRITGLIGGFLSVIRSAMAPQGTSLGASGDQKAASRASRWTPLLLAAAVGAINLAAMPRFRTLGDPYAAAAEARAIVLTGRLAVEPAIESLLGGAEGQYVVRNPADGRLYSKYGLMNAIVAVPQSSFVATERPA